MIPVRVEPAFWFLAALIGWLNGGSIPLAILWIAMVFLSVLVHEYGHAVTALVFGQRPRITLTLFGGVTTRSGPHINRAKEFLIVFNGPAAGFMLYLLCQLLLATPLKEVEGVAYFLSVGTLTNLFWTILNLVPVQPLDGGQLLMILSRTIFGARGVRIAYFLSLIVSIALGALFFFIGALLAGAIFLLFAFESFRAFHQARFITEKDEDEGIKKEFQEASRMAKRGRSGPAEDLYRDILEKAPEGMLHMASSAKLAELLAEKENWAEVHALLSPMTSELDLPDLLLLQKAAFSLGNYPEALKTGEKIYQEQALSEAALFNAMSASMLQKVEAALGWLRAASNEGLDLREAAKDRHFDPVRHLDAFKSIVNSPPG